jgi:hypothetical protein
MRYSKDCVICPNCKKKRDDYIGTLEENLCGECRYLNPRDANIPTSEMPWPEYVDGKEIRVLIDTERQIVWKEVRSFSTQDRHNRKFFMTDGNELSPAAQSYIKAVKNSWE